MNNYKNTGIPPNFSIHKDLSILEDRLIQAKVEVGGGACYEGYFLSYT